MKFSLTAILLTVGLAMAAPAPEPENLEKKACASGETCISGTCQWLFCDANCWWNDTGRPC